MTVQSGTRLVIYSVLRVCGWLVPFWVETSRARRRCIPPSPCCVGGKAAVAEFLVPFWVGGVVSQYPIHMTDDEILEYIHLIHNACEPARVGGGPV